MLNPDHVLISILVHPSLQGVHLVHVADYSAPGHRFVDRLQSLFVRSLPGGFARDLDINIVTSDVVRAPGSIRRIGNGISQMPDNFRRGVRAFSTRPRPGEPRQSARGSRSVARCRGASRQRHFPPSYPSVDWRFPSGSLPRPRRGVLLQSRRPGGVQDLRQSRRPREVTVLFDRASGGRETRGRPRDILQLRARLHARATPQNILPRDLLHKRGSAFGVLASSPTDRRQRSRSFLLILSRMERLDVILDAPAPQDLLPGDRQAARHRVEGLAVVPGDGRTPVARVPGRRPPDGSSILLPATRFRGAEIQGGIRIWVWAVAARIMQCASAAAAG